MVFESLKDRVTEVFSTEEEQVIGDEVIDNLEIDSGSNEIIHIDEPDDIQELDVRYPLIKPFANARIFFDEEEGEILYSIEEPELNEKEEEIFNKLKRGMEKKIDVSLSELDSTSKIVDYLGSKIQDVAYELGMEITNQNLKKLMYFIYRDFAGLNELEPLMHDPYIEDIGVSGLRIPTYIVHSKFGSIKTSLMFDKKSKLKNLVVKLAERSGKYVSYAEPLLDGSLPDGSRVNASLTEDVTTKGPTISIRKFQETPYSAVDLIRFGTVDYDIMAYFWMALQYDKSILTAGGTATGKTTFLNSVVTFIPPEQKIVSIEDTRELQLPHENWIPSVSRSSFGLGADTNQDIGMHQLLKESFRQNPDYVVVGEVRGKEASVLFQGMSSGHPSLGTLHASSPRAVVKRLTTPPINLSSSLVESLDIIVILTRARQYGENARRVKGVYEIETITDDGSPRTNQYISWTPIDDTFSLKRDSNILNNIRQQFGYTQDELEEELDNRTKVLKWMDEQDINEFSKVAKIVSEYYNDKEMILEAVEEDYSFEEMLNEGEVEEVVFEKEDIGDIAVEKEEPSDENVPGPDELTEGSGDDEQVSGSSEDKMEDPFEGEEITENPFGEEDIIEENPFEDDLIEGQVVENPFE